MWMPTMRQHYPENRPRLRCGCGRLVNPDMLLDLTQAPPTVRNAFRRAGRHELPLGRVQSVAVRERLVACDVCRAIAVETEGFPEAELMRGLRAPARLVARAAARDEERKRSRRAEV